jgi:hypothetical protein
MMFRIDFYGYGLVTSLISVTEYQGKNEKNP